MLEQCGENSGLRLPHVVAADMTAPCPPANPIPDPLR
jgi:hypothetical protein